MNPNLLHSNKNSPLKRGVNNYVTVIICYKDLCKESGHRITPQAAYRAFKLVVTEPGMPHVRFHDLHHSYAVASLRSVDDVKTVQENLGHATAAFTLDVYGHVTEQMKTESANRMEAFIQSVST
jgi:integrase